MSKNSSANRTELASGPGCRVELDEQGTLHVYSGDTCLKLGREACEDLAVTLARAVITLAKRQSVAERRAKLRLV